MLIMKRHMIVKAVMDGVVIVEERTGALHFTRSFSQRFDRRHAKSDRMNLGALLFALQNFACNSMSEDNNSNCNSRDEMTQPGITLFQTANESIVFARSAAHGLLIALAVHSSMDVAVARSLVQRIAFHYDHGDGVDARLGLLLNQSGRRFREAGEKAIADEIDSLLLGFASALKLTSSSSTQPATIGFISVYYSPSFRAQASSDDYDDDHILSDSEDNDCHSSGKESATLLASPTPTRRQPEPPQRLQKLFESTRSLLPLPSNPRSHHKNTKTGKVKRNAVMHHTGSRAFQRFLCLPPSSSASGADEPLAKLIRHAQFPQLLVDTLEPIVKTMAPIALSERTGSQGTGVRPLIEMTWRKFPVPRFSVDEGAATNQATNKPLAVDLHVWKRAGCVLVCTNPSQFQRQDGVHGKAMVTKLLDDVEPMARCALQLSS